jgi:uncharacterized protein (UPF0332 family)
MDAQPAFDWPHFLALAGEWYANPAMTQYAEALYRSISSRAYYAAYHAAEEVAVALGMEVTSSASDHYRVRHFYTSRGRLASQRSIILRDLYRLRSDADYEHDKTEMTINDPNAAARRALALSTRAIQLLAHLQTKN